MNAILKDPVVAAIFDPGNRIFGSVPDDVTLASIAPLPPFEPFRKIARLSRNCVITEKIDGTNAQLFITEDGQRLYVGSRNRWITPQTDNFGFARWAYANEAELLKLGPGRHFGEWWGHGIQRGYGLQERRFSLFNSGRWSNAANRPSCVGVVPVLYAGIFFQEAIETTLRLLRVRGSAAAPGFMQPEGIVVYHAASRSLFKKTLENDEQPKGATATDEVPAREARFLATKPLTPAIGAMYVVPGENKTPVPFVCVRVGAE